MDKILIKIKDDIMTFTNVGDVKLSNVDDTNIISDNLLFTIPYIRKNKELVSAFLDVLCFKSKVSKLAFYDNNLVKVFLPLFKDSRQKISTVILIEDKEIDYNIFKPILESNIEKLNCYYLPPYMMDILNDKRRIKTIIRKKIDESDGEFIKNNALYTYTDIYYRKTIEFRDKPSKRDLFDLDFFFRINNNLRQINLLYFDLDLINHLINLMKITNKKNVELNVFYDGLDNISLITEKLKKDNSEFFKNNSSHIMINYTKEYRKKYGIKIVNLNFIKASLFVLLIFFVFLMGIMKYDIYAANKEIEEVSQMEDLDNQDSALLKLPILKKDFVVGEEEKPIERKVVNSPYYRQYDKKLSSLKKINKDTVGWLNVSNTTVNYPIVQSKDNDYYLNRSFYHVRNNHGWIFMDYRNNEKKLDRNTIIYGHRNNEGIMFASLQKTINPYWYNNSKSGKISLTTENGVYEYQIFSIYTVPVISDYLRVSFSSNQDFLNFANKMKKRSVKNFGVEIKEDDKIITLSTCYGGPDKRLVVHAVLKKVG